jgi:polyisoprenoid-binding protein YceI
MLKRLVLLIAVIGTLATPAIAQAQTWQIDTAHSAAHFAVKHNLIAMVRGTFDKVTGTVEFDGKDITKAKINATIDVATINTRVAARNDHLKTADFFNVARFPAMTFVSTSITAAGAGKFKLNGNLTLMGVTKPVSLDMNAPVGPYIDKDGVHHFGALATGKIKRTDFGMKWANAITVAGLTGIDISDDVDITLDVEVLRKP